MVRTALDGGADGHRLLAVTEPLARCGVDHCPNCRGRVPCGRDHLLRAFALPVLDPIFRNGLLTRESTTGAWIGLDKPGGWRYHHQAFDAAPTGWQMSRAGRPAGPLMADAVSALLLRAFPIYGDQPDRGLKAQDLVARVVSEGCEDPIAWEMLANQEETAGRAADLTAAPRPATPPSLAARRRRQTPRGRRSP